MQALTLNRASHGSITRERPDANRTVLAGAAGLASAVLMLLALLPAFAGTAVSTPAGTPAALPAPGPVIVVGG